MVAFSILADFSFPGDYGRTILNKLKLDRPKLALQINIKEKFRKNIYIG